MVFQGLRHQGWADVENPVITWSFRAEAHHLLQHGTRANFILSIEMLALLATRHIESKDLRLENAIKAYACRLILLGGGLSAYCHYVRLKHPNITALVNS